MLALFHLFVCYQAALAKPSPIPEWRKGPLVNDVSPYSSMNAHRIFWPAAAVRLGRRVLPAGGEAKADTKPTAAWLNRAMLAWHRMEAAWIARFNAPMGLSLLTVREKRGA